MTNADAVDQLGDHWSFTFSDEKGQKRIHVRVGVPGARLLVGSVKLATAEAEQLRKVVAAAGAVVLP